MRETPIAQNSLLPCISHIAVLSGVQSQLEIHATIEVFLEGLEAASSFSRSENTAAKTSRRFDSYVHHNPGTYRRVYTYTSELQKWLSLS